MNKNNESTNGCFFFRFDDWKIVAAMTAFVQDAELIVTKENKEMKKKKKQLYKTTETDLA